MTQESSLSVNLEQLTEHSSAHCAQDPGRRPPLVTSTAPHSGDRICTAATTLQTPLMRSGRYMPFLTAAPHTALLPVSITDFIVPWTIREMLLHASKLCEALSKSHLALACMRR